MYCNQCGKALTEGSLYCSYCGVKQPEIKLEKVASLDKPLLKHSHSEERSMKEVVSIQLPRKEREAMSFGILVSIIFIILYIIYASKGYGSIDSVLALVLSILTSLARLISIAWIIGIARRLKRSQFGWAMFALFSPALAMIIIGNLTYSRATIRKLKQGQKQPN